MNFSGICFVRPVTKKVAGLFVVIFLLSIVGLFFPIPANAAPWWWTQFTQGNDAFDNQSNYEKWAGQYVSSATPDEDVWLASYTWGTGNNAPVNGFFGDSEEGGINKVFLRRTDDPAAAPVRVLGDGDNRGILDLTVSGLPVELSPRNENLDGFEGRSHHKAIMLGDRSIMVGSANITAGAFSSQPNNMTIIRGMPKLNQGFRREFEEQFSGTHFDNSESERNHFTSPAGDRVSVYFAPDDNFNISLPSGESGLKLDDVLEKHTRDASESIHYLFNVMFLGDLSNTMINASDNKLVEGALDNGGSDIVDNFRSSHTSRDANSFYSGEMHHKFMIFDQEIVAFGSANHTRSAMFRTIGDRNEENLVVVHDFRMGRRYMQEYRRVMSRLDEETEGQPDSFDSSSPNPPTNFVVQNDADASNSLELLWDPPQDPGDFSRYYVFVADHKLSEAHDIGDAVDADGDGLIDEDPRGDADGFASGPSSSELNPADDDADGRVDEDPWLAPEKQIKVSDPASVTSTTLRTFNVEETLPNNKDLWVGLVAVDKHGNESKPVFQGPVRSFDGGANIIPSVDQFVFDDGASDEAGETSVLSLQVENGDSSTESITRFTVDFGTGDSAFVTREQTRVPEGFSVSRTSSTLSYTATDGGIAPGNILDLSVDVTNPSDSGPSQTATVNFEDESGNTVEDVEAGSLEIADAPLQEGEGNAIEKLSVSGSGKTIRTFDGSRELGKPAYKFNAVLEQTPDSDVEVYWDAERSPDGPVGSASDQRILLSEQNGSYVGTISDTDELSNGELLEFLLFVDGERFDLSGTPYSFTIDRTVSDPSLTGINSTGFESVEVGINGISDGDFATYRVYFTTESTVSTSDSFQEFTNQTADALTVGGLSPGTTYRFAVTALDRENNESALSTSAEATTRQSVGLQSIKVENQDGLVTATELDGSESFRVEPVTVKMDFDTDVSDVRVFYDVGDNPDGPGGSNSEERKVSANGSGTVWEAGIPSDDSEIQAGETLKFVVVTDDRVIRNDGIPFRYNYRKSPPTISGLSVSDTGGGNVTISWTPVTDFLNFSHYRLYYERGSDTPTVESSSWGPAQEAGLALDNTGKATVGGLAPDARYRFRAAIVDEKGQVGPLSKTVDARPQSSGVLLLTEASRQSNPKWVELTSFSPDVDLRNFVLTDMDGSTGVISSEKTTLNRGERAKVTFTTGTSESDQTGDQNGNGYLDVFRPSMSSFALNDPVDQLVVRSTSGETVDVLAYREDPSQGLSAGEQTDLNTLVNLGHWNSSDSSGLVNLYTRTQLNRRITLSRWEILPGDFSDDNDRADWELTAKRTPGIPNRFLHVNGISLSDVPTAPEDYFRSRAGDLDGSEFLKDTPNYRLTMDLSQHPPHDTGFVVWYDTDASPTGFSSPDQSDSAVITDEYDPSSKRLTAKIPLDGIQQGDEVQFLVSIIPDPNNPTDFDERITDRSGRFYRFYLDDRSPDAPTGLQLTDRTRDGLVLGWSPISNPPKDFREYRIYYDTGTVTAGSSFFDASRISTLSDPDVGQAEVPVPVSSDTWHFRIGSVDQTGNGNGFGSPSNDKNLSDTLSKKRLKPISVDDLLLDPGSITVSGTETLPAENVTVRVVFDRRTNSPKLVWDKNDAGNLPDETSGADTTVTMSHVSGGEYRASIPAANHGDVIQFIFSTDGGDLNNEETGYLYRIDDRAVPAVPGFQADTIQVTNFENATTDISVGWKVLPDSVTDFKHYLVAYEKGTSVSKNSNTIGPDKFDHLTRRKIGSATVGGLDRADTYTLGVFWKDDVGNVSALSETTSIQTVDAQPTEDPAWDGKFYARDLDGSEYLRKGDIRIEFEFSQTPAYPGDVHLVYNIGGEPGEDGTKKVSMSPQSNTVFRTWIPESDRMTEGTYVNYYIQEGPWEIRPSEGVFSFRIDEHPPPDLGGVTLSDNETYVGVYWNPISSDNDFQEYRIRYRKPSADQWTVIDGSNNPDLKDYRTGSTYLENLDSSSNYYVDITAVDKMGRTQYLSSLKKLQRTTNFTPVLEVTPNYLKLHPDETGKLEVYLEDLDGNPWGNQSVVWKKIGGPGSFVASDNQTIETVTDSRGRTSVQFTAGNQENWFTHFELSFPDSPGVETVSVGLYTVPSDKPKSTYQLYTD